MKDFAKSIRTNNSSVCNKATVLKDGNVWVVLYANETKSQEFETEAEAREFAKKVGNSKVGNYMMNPSGQVEDLIKSSEKYIASGDKEGAKRLFGSMEIVFRQLKEDKEEHYKKYQEADDLLGKLNKAAGKLKSIL